MDWGAPDPPESKRKGKEYPSLIGDHNCVKPSGPNPPFPRHDPNSPSTVIREGGRAPSLRASASHSAIQEDSYIQQMGCTLKPMRGNKLTCGHQHTISGVTPGVPFLHSSGARIPLM
ncbi:hypothetical protein CEXT_147311 [Caerostris extrusa]|uniref:Uncharacterized protein n=1 Tax=Caerostris extrusa TaxID=172846 RepID=A0AAV4SZT2_CAEEX|nr:hypothetical protein CEXT_147311 [Caerostris extrusa]